MKRIQTAVGLGIIAFCLTSRAAVLAPGDIAPLTPQAAPTSPPATVLDTLTSPYNFGTFMGTVTSWVVAGDPANTLGGLSFYYQVNNTGTEELSRFSASSFDSLLTDVNGINVTPAWNGSLAGGVTPFDASRSANGTVIGFDFLGAANIPGGAHSEVLVVHTSSPVFTIGMGAVIDNASYNINVLSPVAVPEPATMMAGLLLLVPFAGSALRILRRC